MSKYSDYVAKARAIKDIGEWITSRIDSINNDTKWYLEQKQNYLDECEAQGTTPSEWRIQDFEENLSSNATQIKTLEKIEKYLSKEMGE